MTWPHGPERFLHQPAVADGPREERDVHRHAAFPIARALVALMGVRDLVACLAAIVGEDEDAIQLATALRRAVGEIEEAIDDDELWRRDRENRDERDVCPF